MISSNPSCSSSPPKGTRDLFIDFLRGVCVVSMVFTHAGEGTAVLRLSLSRTIGFFSGAEGFFFLSGLVFGRVYHRRLCTRGVQSAGAANWSRVFTLYKYHVACLVCLFVAVVFFPERLLSLSDTYRLAIEDPITAIIRGCLLVYQPKYLDVLPLYLVYMPLAWFLIKTGRDNSIWVLSVSLFVWALQQFTVTAVGTYISRGAFNVLSYQAVFFLGLWAARGTPRQLIARQGNVSVSLVLSIIVVVSCFLLSHPKMFGLVAEDLELVVNATMAQCEKFSLGWLRLLNFVAVALLIHQARPWLGWVPVNSLASLGKRSLGVFVGHIALILLFCGPLLELREMPSKVFLILALLAVTTVAVALRLIDRAKENRLAAAVSDVPMG